MATAASSRFARGMTPPRVEILVLAIVALLILVAFGPLMSLADFSMTGEGSPVRQGAYLFVAGLILFSVRPLAEPQRLLVLPVALLIALGWCWISVTWAIQPGIALRRLVLTTIIMWSIFAAVEQLGYDRTMLLIRAALVIILVLNYAAVLGLPEVGIHQANEPYDKALIGEWRGVMAHKNFAGITCAVAILVFLYDARRIPLALRTVVIAAAGFFLWQTGSRTSLGDCIGAAVIGLLFLRYNTRYRLVVVPLACLALLVAASITNFYADPLNALLTQKSTLSGRLDIWDMLLRYSHDHPVLGSGYGSFWNIGGESPVYRYGKGWLVDLASGHNGFLDLMVTIGVPGLVIVLGAAVVWPLVRLFSSKAVNGARAAVILSIFVFCVAHNSTESSLFDRDAIGQVFLMFSIALLWTVTKNAPVRRATSGSGRGALNLGDDYDAAAPARRAL